jgi:uncharacterized protein YdeI (YjbR/CyaY-like superfamily)
MSRRAKSTKSEPAVEESSIASSSGPASLPIISFECLEDWESWLEAHHSEPAGLWVKISKKGAATPTISYGETLDSALCYGWIDGQKKSHCEEYFIQKFTPRRKNSLWSKRNVDKVEDLIKSGRMRQSGQAEIDAAKADGRWERAYLSPSLIQVSPDFQSALDANKKAKKFFESLNKTKRYSFLWRIETAKRADTRQRRIQQFVEMLAKHQSL